MLLSLYLFTSVPSLHANWKMENQISVYFKVAKNVTSQSAQSFTSLHNRLVDFDVHEIFPTCTDSGEIRPEITYFLPFNL